MAESNPGMKHVGRKELYTSFETRLAYLHDFIDFNAADIEALATGAKYIKTLIPAIVNIVYKKLVETDITARAFHTNNTADETPIEHFVSEDSPQILHRKMFLRMYLLKLCSDPTQLDFWRYLDKVGMVHTGKGRKSPLNIEYVHIGICLGFIQDIFTEALLSHPRLSMQRKIALVRAIGKVIWIQNDLFAKWYVRDGEEYADEASVLERDEEGYINGKKILTEDISGESGQSSNEEDNEGKDREKKGKEAESPAGSEKMGCPFAGMVPAGRPGSGSKIPTPAPAVPGDSK
ncbi:hypothetical protein KEM52_003591 [Ascosphaera acerosa]|nr:hypothetical protein KEM52_003591 [Ascosphaera acerosa]